MRLSRRDALAALTTTGVAAAVGGRAFLDGGDSDETTSPLPDDALATLVAVADVVYPDAATNVDTFVATYVAGRVADDPDHRAGVVDALAELDATARDWFDAPVADLDPSARDGLLRDLSVDTVDPDPEGTLSGQVRFYVVNELLYAFYASPTGGRLVGIENPVGYPGGTESYQRARMPEEDDG